MTSVAGPGTDWAEAAETMVADVVSQILQAIGCLNPAELVRSITGHPERLIAAAAAIADEIQELELLQDRLRDEMFLISAWEGRSKQSLGSFMTETHTAIRQLRQGSQELHDGLLTNARALEDAARFIIAGAIALTSAALAAIALMVSYPVAGLALLRFIAVRWYSVGDAAAKIASAGFLSYLVWDAGTARLTAFDGLGVDQDVLGEPAAPHASPIPTPTLTPTLTWDQARDDARAAFPTFDRLSPARQHVLAELARETGRSGVRQFRDLRAALAHGDYDAAARELLDSRWARGAGTRAHHHAAVLRGRG